MTKYLVEIARTIRTTVEVEAATPEAARETVDHRDFELPPHGRWSGDKDWQYIVMDADGTELIDVDGNQTEDHSD